VATFTASVDRRYRYVYKPLLFALCLIPFLGCAGGILRLSGINVLPGYALGADPVRFVLDDFGKSAIRMLLLTLAVTPLRHWTGNAQLLRVRRMLGLFAFFYALLHFSVYVGPFQSFSWSAIAQDIVKRPYITLGFTALLLLVPLAITSTNGMMRRLRQRWTQLHRLIYPVALLAVVHFWKMLKSDYREPLVYAVILAVLLGARLWRRYARARAAAAAAATSTSGLPRAPERT
jgi:sulfoxide reductase heme-binding subunit YedZ